MNQAPTKKWGQSHFPSNFVNERKVGLINQTPADKVGLINQAPTKYL